MTEENKNIFNHLNQIYFGGGEPTLYLDALERIITSYYSARRSNKFPDWYIPTRLFRAAWPLREHSYGQIDSLSVSPQRIPLPSPAANTGSTVPKRSSEGEPFAYSTS